MTLKKLLFDTQMPHLYKDLKQTHADSTVDNTLTFDDNSEANKYHELKEREEE